MNDLIFTNSKRVNIITNLYDQFNKTKKLSLESIIEGYNCD